MVLVKIAVANIEQRYSVTVASIVADNENANKALFTLIRGWRPWTICIGCAAHGFQLVLQDTFNSAALVRQAMRAVDRVLRVFQRNPALNDWLLKVQHVQEGSRPHKLVYWGETRWNTKCDAMQRVLELHDVVNVVMSKDPVQVPYRLNSEEVRSMELVLPLLKPICHATDRVQANETNLRTLHSMKLMVSEHLEQKEKDPTLLPVCKIIRDALKKHARLGHVDEHAGACAFLLDPKERPQNETVEGRDYLLEHALPFLLHRRFGDISAWPAERLADAKAHVVVKLQSQLNLYCLRMNPFADDLVIMSDPISYWQSKLNVAQELAEFALFLFS
eukprot:EG_transcript_19701